MDGVCGVWIECGWSVDGVSTQFGKLLLDSIKLVGEFSPEDDRTPEPAVSKDLQRISQRTENLEKISKLVALKHEAEFFKTETKNGASG